MSHEGYSICRLVQSSSILVWFWQAFAEVHQKSVRARTKPLSCTHIVHEKSMYLLLNFCFSLSVKVIKTACVFLCSSPLWQRGVTVFLQQINISTHVSGPSTRCTGWKPFTKLLWRKKMMPYQPWESGISLNNGVIEGGVPACVAVSLGISLMSTGLATLQQRPFPLGMDVTSFS